MMSRLTGEGNAMGQKIERDYQRFRKLVRGKVKSNLSKYISRGELIGKKGRDLVSIPLPQIEIPQFRYGQKNSGGVGQGDGDVGQPLTKPQSVAAIIYMMDVSGSMTDEQKEIVRIESFWIDMWIKAHYQGIETAYIVHDAVAHEVDEHTFYHTRESGGTKISSAYEMANKIIEKRYPPDQWNLYAFHFSDGDNWGDDVPRCVELLKSDLLPKLNLFGYGKVESPYGSGEFYEYVHEMTGDHVNIVTSRIPDRDAILGSIKEFLGTGR